MEFVRPCVGAQRQPAVRGAVCLAEGGADSLSVSLRQSESLSRDIASLAVHTAAQRHQQLNNASGGQTEPMSRQAN